MAGTTTFPGAILPQAGPETPPSGPAGRGRQQRAAAGGFLGDGWLPTRLAPEEVQAGRAKLDELAMVVGRDPRSIQITVHGLRPDPEMIKRFGEAGAVRAVVSITHMMGSPGLTPTEDASLQLERLADQLLDGAG